MDCASAGMGDVEVLPCDMTHCDKPSFGRLPYCAHHRKQYLHNKNSAAPTEQPFLSYLFPLLDSFVTGVLAVDETHSLAELLVELTLATREVLCCWDQRTLTPVALESLSGRARTMFVLLQAFREKFPKPPLADSAFVSEVDHKVRHMPPADRLVAYCVGHKEFTVEQADKSGELLFAEEGDGRLVHQADLDRLVPGYKKREEPRVGLGVLALNVNMKAEEVKPCQSPRRRSSIWRVGQRTPRSRRASSERVSDTDGDDGGSSPVVRSHTRSTSGPERVPEIHKYLKGRPEEFTRLKRLFNLMAEACPTSPHCQRLRDLDRWPDDASGELMRLQELVRSLRCIEFECKCKGNDIKKCSLVLAKCFLHCDGYDVLDFLSCSRNRDLQVWSLRGIYQTRLVREAAHCCQARAFSGRAQQWKTVRVRQLDYHLTYLKPIPVELLFVLFELLVDDVQVDFVGPGEDYREMHVRLLRDITQPELLPLLLALTVPATSADTERVYRNLLVLINNETNAGLFLDQPGWQVWQFPFLTKAKVDSTVYNLIIAVMTDLQYAALERPQEKDKPKYSVMWQTRFLLEEEKGWTSHTAQCCRDLFSGLLHKVKSRQRYFTFNFDFSVVSHRWDNLFHLFSTLIDFIFHHPYTPYSAVEWEHALTLDESLGLHLHKTEAGWIAEDIPLIQQAVDLLTGMGLDVVMDSDILAMSGGSQNVSQNERELKAKGAFYTQAFKELAALLVELGENTTRQTAKVAQLLGEDSAAHVLERLRAWKAKYAKPKHKLQRLRTRLSVSLSRKSLLANPTSPVLPAGKKAPRAPSFHPGRRRKDKGPPTPPMFK